MKVLKLTMLIMLLSFNSCSNENNPEFVAEQFLNHMSNFEFNKATAYCDEETTSMINVMGGIVAMSKDADQEKGATTYKIFKTDIDNDSATVHFNQITKGKSKKNLIPLKKIDGKWKVSMGKEHINKEGSENSFFRKNNEEKETTKVE